MYGLIVRTYRGQETSRVWEEDGSTLCRTEFILYRFLIFLFLSFFFLIDVTIKIIGIREKENKEGCAVDR